MLHKIDVPAKNVTSCAFGCENLDELYISTPSAGMSNQQPSEFPLAGFLFKVKPVAKGNKAFYFKELQY